MWPVYLLSIFVEEAWASIPRVDAWGIASGMGRFPFGGIPVWPWPRISTLSRKDSRRDSCPLIPFGSKPSQSKITAAPPQPVQRPEESRGDKPIPQGSRTGLRIDMCITCNYVHSMAKMIQVRNVPDALHRSLKARAAMAGMSLSDYLLVEFREIAERPTLAEFRERLHKRKPLPAVLDTGGLLREERSAR
jgi:antitoxin FitA